MRPRVNSNLPSSDQDEDLTEMKDKKNKNKEKGYSFVFTLKLPIGRNFKFAVAESFQSRNQDKLWDIVQSLPLSWRCVSAY